MAKRKLRDLVLTIVGTTGALGGLLLGVGATPAHAASYAGTVATGGVLLNVRVGPTTKAAREGTLPHKTKISIICQVPGEKIWGRVRTTNLWDRPRTPWWGGRR